MKKDCSNCARERFSIPCYDCLIGNNSVPSRWVEGENYVPDTIAMRAIQQISRRAKSTELAGSGAASENRRFQGAVLAVEAE